MKAFLNSHTGPRKQAQVGSEAETVHMEERQDIDNDIIRRKPPAVLQCAQSGSHIGLRVNHTLRPACGAGAVDHQAWIFHADARSMNMAGSCVPDLDVAKDRM